MVTIPAVLLLVIALVLLLIEAFSLKLLGKVHAGWLGLAFLTAATLWPNFVKVGGG